jgi:hypothetical protein
MSLGAVAVLRARKPNPSSEKLYPSAAVTVKKTAFAAAEWEVGAEKNDEAPLIWAALSQPVEEVNERNVELLAMAEIVIPGIGPAELANEPLVKWNWAKVAAWADRQEDASARPIHLDVDVIMGEACFMDDTNFDSN